jgi:hypothetical protein
MRRLRIRTFVFSATGALLIVFAGAVGSSLAATPPPPGNSALKVRLADPLNNPLPGGKFALTADGKKGTIRLGTFTKDGNGEICVDGLADGTYAWTQTQAPRGYNYLPKNTQTATATSGDCATGSIPATPFTDIPTKK